jgi:hypothetical protein
MVVIAKTARVLTCPGCHRHVRWSGTESARVRCPRCRIRFVALVRLSGECAAVLEDDDTVGQMVADWLRPNWDDGDSPSPGTASTSSAERLESNETGAAPDPSAPAVIIPIAPAAAPAPKLVQPDGTPKRKVG